MRKGDLPALETNSFKSTFPGSDGMVLSSTTYVVGDVWYLLVHASPGSHWSLFSGEPFVQILGPISTNAGNLEFTIGPERMRFFQASVPAGTLAWRLYMNGATNQILLRKGWLPLLGATDVPPKSQMLVVPG